jgi:cardiolipin synthase
MSNLNQAICADFYLEGKNYFDYYLKLINEAQDSIHLHTYIFDMDSFGSRVFEALSRAALRGVQVHLLIDSFGSKNFSTQYEMELKSINIYFHRFNSFNYKWIYQWGRRLHHKILLIDQKKAMVGGINVTTSGYGKKQVTQQLDFAVYVEGPILFEINKYCNAVFKKVYPQKTLKPLVIEKIKSVLKNEPFIQLKISINDWIDRRYQITKQYSKLTQRAQNNITIINPYFFPRKRFMKQLISAAKRGVRVRLILPKISDWPSYILASEYLYLYFLNNGVEIYQWNKSILHGKLATVDGIYATIGSFNLNHTSYQHNLELNIDLYSSLFTSQLDLIIEDLIKIGCDQVELVQFKKSASLRIRFLRFFYYHILSLVVRLSASLIFHENGAPQKKSFNT